MKKILLCAAVCAALASCAADAPAAPQTPPTATGGSPTYEQMASWASPALRSAGGFDACLSQAAQQCLQSSAMEAAKAGAADLNACDAIRDDAVREGCRAGISAVLSEIFTSPDSCAGFGDQEAPCRRATALRLAAETGDAAWCASLAGTGAQGAQADCALRAALGAARRGDPSACATLTGPEADMCRASAAQAAPQAPAPTDPAPTPRRPHRTE